eukprot:64084-Chlamydomonas_euryale.AAC.1
MPSASHGGGGGANDALQQLAVHAAHELGALLHERARRLRALRVWERQHPVAVGERAHGAQQPAALAA